MTRKRKVKRRTNQLGKVHFLYLGLFILLGIYFIYSNVFAARTGGAGGGAGGGYNLAGGCALQTNRPCYDKLTSSGVNILARNGENTFASCSTNAAPNKVGEIIQRTSVCGQEKVQYCHDGKSSNYIRKFSGQCDSDPPPSPPPSPEPSPTSSPVSTSPFRITYPNGGEQLPFGSQQTVTWEGGDRTNEWPIYLSLVDRDRNVAIREMVINSPNDGQENWIVDLPLGNYYVYYGQGCRFSTCTASSEWDQSDNKFSVVAGEPVEKINSPYSLNQSLVVLNPAGGEVWTTESTQTIKWSGKIDTSTISLSLVDDKQSYVSIVRNSANDGSEQWLVPGFIPPGQYKVYVSCSNCESPPSGFTGGNYSYSFYPFMLR